MVRLENLKRLSVRIGVGGGIATFIMINTIPYIMNKQIKELEVYKEAIKMIKNNPEAIKYLGEPIEEVGHINVTNKETYGKDEKKMWWVAAVKGPKTIGNVYCESNFTTKDEGSKLELAKVELTLKSVPGYKLMIKRSE